jgi:hypothetical protein
MRQPQVCDHCRGRFGMVTHRWWGNKFCKRTCKDAYLRELALDRDKIRRWYGFPSRGDNFKLLSPACPNSHVQDFPLRTATAFRTSVPTPSAHVAVAGQRVAALDDQASTQGGRREGVGPTQCAPVAPRPLELARGDSKSVSGMDFAGKFR